MTHSRSLGPRSRRLSPTNILSANSTFRADPLAESLTTIFAEYSSVIRCCSVVYCIANFGGTEAAPSHLLRGPQQAVCKRVRGTLSKWGSAKLPKKCIGSSSLFENRRRWFFALSLPIKLPSVAIFSSIVFHTFNLLGRNEAFYVLSSLFVARSLITCSCSSDQVMFQPSSWTCSLAAEQQREVDKFDYGTQL